MEIDLHIEKLRPSCDLKPYEILDFQMNKVKNILKTCRQRKGLHIIFIHGQGAGKLRSEIIREVQECYPSYICQDAAFCKYGFRGATEVVVR